MTARETHRGMTALGRTDLDVFPICLGGNVFGWTADEAQSRAVLDAYVAAGGNFIDTSNSYMDMIEHGRSEKIIGRWMAERGNRDQLVIATKVGGGRGATRNLRRDTIASEVQGSLERLQIDRIDLYYAHYDDLQTPLGETLPALDELVKAGIVRHLAASNYSPERLAAAIDHQRERGLAEYEALQPHYNLVEREFERALRPVAERFGLAVLPYYALASGFLTGKYRPGGKPRLLGARRHGERVPGQGRWGGARGARRGGRPARMCARRGGRGVAARAADGRRADRQRAHDRAARGDSAGRLA